MQLTILSAADLAEALPMPRAVAAMKDAFAALSAGEARVPQRTVIESPEHDAVTLDMPAVVSGLGLGTKLVSVFPRNRERDLPVVNGLVVLLDPETGAPRALCEGSELTALRTGAASGAATDLLARDDARIGAVIGTGAQARTQLLAIDAVRELESIRIFSRSPESIARFVVEMEPRVGARLEAATSARAAVEGADVICAATSSAIPVLDGDWLAPGCHLNGVGSYTTEMQEVDEASVRRCRIFVDQRSAALAEAGDLVIARRAGVTSPERWTELGEVVRNPDLGRRNREERTFFKSVGVAVQDIVAGAVAVAEARRRGLGQTVEL